MPINGYLPPCSVGGFDQSGLKLLLDKNSINFGDVIQKNGFRAWKGDEFQIEHPVIDGNDIIIITNE